jgi:hypothetical protein
MTNTATETAGTLSRRARPRRALLMTALVLASALAIALATTPQAHSQTPNPDPGTKLGTPQSDGSAANVLSHEATAVRCGYYTVDVTLGPDIAFYYHCGSTRICIRVDDRFRADRREEVGPWEHKRLGTTAGVRGAWYIGLPHPTLRCHI